MGTAILLAARLLQQYCMFIVLDTDTFTVVGLVTVTCSISLPVHHAKNNVNLLNLQSTLLWSGWGEREGGGEGALKIPCEPCN